MKATILAAGYGNRIADLTKGKPKSFLEINGKPIVQHQLDMLRSVGIKDIVMVVGYKKHFFEELKEKNKDLNITLVYNPFYRVTNVLGSFWFTKEFLTEPFVFMHADTYFEPDILDKLLATSGNNLAVEFKNCGEEDMKVKVEEGIIKDISKKLEQSDGEFIGVAKIDGFSDVKSSTEELIEDNAHCFFETAILNLIKSNKKFNAIKINGHIWEEVDFKEDYFSLIEKIKNKENNK